MFRGSLGYHQIPTVHIWEETFSHNRPSCLMSVNLPQKLSGTLTRPMGTSAPRLRIQYLLQSSRKNWHADALSWCPLPSTPSPVYSEASHTFPLAFIPIANINPEQRNDPHIHKLVDQLAGHAYSPTRRRRSSPQHFRMINNIFYLHIFGPEKERWLLVILKSVRS